MHQCWAAGATALQMLELERRILASDDLHRLIASSTTEMALSALQRLFDRYGLPSKSLATGSWVHPRIFTEPPFEGTVF
jgi:hypothetical protein